MRLMFPFLDYSAQENDCIITLELLEGVLEYLFTPALITSFVFPYLFFGHFAFRLILPDFGKQMLVVS